MGISLFRIKKWVNMLRGKSVYHVNQDEGKIYSKKDIRGYYNNLTEKVTRFGLNGEGVPKTVVEKGGERYFPIEIFQYGLAAYDLFLLNNSEEMLSKAISCADWTVDNQNQDGGWDTFGYLDKTAPFSAMAQGEGVSLLLRVYKQTNKKEYIQAAQNAIRFMITPIEQGGTAKYDKDNVLFYEYTNKPLVLNGWIFALWGLWDACQVFQEEHLKEVLDKTLHSLEKKLADDDLGYWSKYDEKKKIASPFYHKLHIAQLRVMYDLTDKEVFLAYAEKWDGYQKSFWKRKRAFIKKAFQKIFER